MNISQVGSWLGNISKQITEFTTIAPEDADDVMEKVKDNNQQTEKEEEKKEKETGKEEESTKEEEENKENAKPPNTEDGKATEDKGIDDDGPKEEGKGDGKDIELEDEKKENEDPLAPLNLDSVMESAMGMGNALFSFASKATDTVKTSARTIRHTIEEKTILGDFEEEQRLFIQEKERNQLAAQTAMSGVAPWVGYNEETVMKKQILNLSLDQRNFLRDPPSGIQFEFNYEAMNQVAVATLEEDPNLRKMRFMLVPKQIKEERFWRNYFYRVSLIKQSAQLTTLSRNNSGSPLKNVAGKDDATEGADPVASTSRDQSPTVVVTSSSSTAKQTSTTKTTSSVKGGGERKESESEGGERGGKGGEGEEEFLSDTAQAEVTEEELERVREQLGIANEGKKEEEWEKEILAELNDYELVSQQTGKSDTEWEDEISQLLMNDDTEKPKPDTEKRVE